VTAFHETARTLAEGMLNGVAEGVVIALFAWVVLQLSGRRSSSTRFAVWFSALIAIATLPLLHGFALRAASGGAGVPASAFTLPGSWVNIIFLGWASIAGFGLLRVAFGFWQVQSLRAGSTTVDPSTLDLQLQRTLQELASRSVTLAVSEQLQVPAAIGFFRPQIVLPAWSLRELSTDELNAVLIHELAHLRRWDDWTNLTQKVLRALFFFHPAVWWVESQISLEREMACDDVVLSKRVSPRSYAECLVSVAEKSFLRRSLVLAQAAVSRMRHTSRRVTQILDAKRSRGTRVWKPALGLVAFFSALCLVVVARAPEVIAFQDAAPNATAATTVAGVSARAIPAKWTEPDAKLSREPNLLSHRTTTSRARATPKQHRLATATVDLNDLSATLLQPPSIQALFPLRAVALPPDGVAVQTIFVVVQSPGDVGAPGTWTLCVWRVTVRSAPTAAALPAKSI